jgi:hypothetical protein
MLPFRAAVQLSREEIAAFLPYQRVFLKYPGAELWHERILAVRRSIPQSWIVITPTLDVYEEDIRAAGVEGYVTDAWGGLPAALRSRCVFRFNEEMLTEHWEILRAEVAEIAGRLADEGPSAAVLPRHLLFGPQAAASQELLVTRGIIGGWPATEVVCGQPCEGCEGVGVRRPCTLRSRHAQDVHVCAGCWDLPHTCAEPCGLHPRSGEGRQRAGELTTMTPEGAAAGGGGGYRGRGPGRG